MKLRSVALLLLLLLTAASVSYAEPAKPNVLILFSNDRTATMPAYPAMTTYDNATDYYGYFDPNKYYEYQKNAGFIPMGWTADHYDPKLRHYVPTGTDTFWSGNFLNWATMSHIDLLRKQLTGGKRGADNSNRTTLLRMSLHDQSRFQKAYYGADLSKLVPASYANPGLIFYNSGTSLTVLNGNRPVSPEMTVEVTVCNPAMPENGCTQYVNVQKPEGLVQRYKSHLNFGLMSHTKAQMTEGGVLRVPLGPVLEEFSQKSGMLNPGDGIINIINDISLDRGWSPTAELYYEALRYLKGNEAGQQTYCGAEETKKEDDFDIIGCDANHPWIDPIADPCQKTSILLVTDEWPSRDSNALPFSAFNPGYVDTPMPFGSNTPYNPDVVTLTNIVGETEGLNRTLATVGNVIGREDNTCTTKYLTSLGAARGLCPAEEAIEGSFYTAGLAYEAFTGDLRPDLPGRQNVRTYVLTYSASPGGYWWSPQPNPLMLAAKYGNFYDRNYSGLPDISEEWMKNAAGCAVVGDLHDQNCQPLGFYYAQSGNIEKALTVVFERDLGADGFCDNVGDSDGNGIVDQDDPFPFDPSK